MTESNRAKVEKIPTEAEFRKVREYQCLTDGHDYDVVVLEGTNEPVVITCGRCARSWTVGKETK